MRNQNPMAAIVAGIIVILSTIAFVWARNQPPAGSVHSEAMSCVTMGGQTLVCMDIPSPGMRCTASSPNTILCTNG